MTPPPSCPRPCPDAPYETVREEVQGRRARAGGRVVVSSWVLLGVRRCLCSPGWQEKA